MGWYKDANGKPVWVDDAAPSAGGGMVVPPDPMQTRRANAGMDSTFTNTNRTRQQMGQDAEMFPIKKRAAGLEAEVAAMKVEQARLAAEAAAREAEAKNPFNPQALRDIEQESMKNLQTVDRIKTTDRNSILPTIGGGAEFVRDHWFGGTGAADIGADVESLQSGGALQRVMQMAQDNGGKNPLTPMSNSDVGMLARGIGNLSQSQSRPNFMANLNNYAEPLKRAYAGAVGMRNMDAELKRLGIDKFPPAVQQRIRADAMRRAEQITARKAATRGGPPRNAPRVDRNNDGIPDDVRGILGKYGVR